MDVREHWEKALRQTEIIRPRIQALETTTSTTLSYILLSESALNSGDTVVRKGEVTVEKPALILPANSPLFEGFEFEKRTKLEQDFVSSFLLVRGVRFPSLKYQNKTYSLDIFEGGISAAADHFVGRLQREENVGTGVLLGPEDCWQFSLLIFICAQVERSAQGDIRRLLDQYRKRNQE